MRSDASGSGVALTWNESCTGRGTLKGSSALQCMVVCSVALVGMLARNAWLGGLMLAMRCADVMCGVPVPGSNGTRYSLR